MLEPQLELNEEQLATLFSQAEAHGEAWRDKLYVQIGRASALLGLKESTIRYIESLAQERTDLKIGRTEDRNRAYSLDDLMLLWVTGQLIDRFQIKHMEALQWVTEELRRRQKATSPLDHDLTAEHSLIADGFILSRICHFLLRLIDKRLGDQHMNRIGFELIALLFPPLERQEEAINDPMHFSQHLGNVLVCVRSEALHRFKDAPRPIWHGLKLDEIEANENTTVTLIQDTDWSLRDSGLYVYPIHRGRASSLRPVLAVLRLQNPHNESKNYSYIIECDQLSEALIQLITRIATDFQPKRRTRSLRFRSDGLPPGILHHELPIILRLFTEAALGVTEELSEDYGCAALLTPDNLDNPTVLRIAESWNYSVDFALTEMLQLGKIVEGTVPPRVDGRGSGPENPPEGLSGQAFRNREIVFSTEPNKDPRTRRWAEEERATNAIAIPLIQDRGMTPYGVIYVVARGAYQLSPERSQVLLLGAQILTELLSRYWSKLYRHWHEELLLNNTTNQRWLTALDNDEYKIVIELLVDWSKNWLSANLRELEQRDDWGVTLIVIDIVRSRQLSEMFPLLIPRALKRLEEDVWQNVKSSLRALSDEPGPFETLPPAWFRGDHLLLGVKNQTEQEYKQLQMLLNRFLKANETFPLEGTGKRQRVTFKACAATTRLTARQLDAQIKLRGLNIDNCQGVRQLFEDVIERLRAKAGSIAIPGTINDGERVHAM